MTDPTMWEETAAEARDRLAMRPLGAWGEQAGLNGSVGQPGADGADRTAAPFPPLDRLDHIEVTLRRLVHLVELQNEILTRAVDAMEAR